ncbi:transcriptional regulator [Salipiger aestuarii]|uniref:DNA-binding GntR family transcriptional regulator n=1 Tax=Salipiger aestuarii TaxID=568098 RepID=A0A327XUL8_9RHOB|nr:GntR family transcriptional regulator [Salipiger aestuarii]EIE49986.1 GntR family transcriptional regulator [Citreicella sp. 357]KAA8605611.1 transcriptional regulator [Salipiger aestuarii]KAA8608242.1 transcriptional regulator [Salipiger aestuarii]KAB2539819.1 transcriptional regulator [Salipiger aestuarii]RAK11992.1 DNA-binding GntR family transcriptional regulator [Salipiger aestuarii]
MNASTAQNIYDRLINGIASGEFPPGDPLAEVALAQRFGVSRTPVREALHRLEQANFAERGPRRAFFVRKMRASDLEELFEAVGELEAAIAALAARRMTEIQRRNLQAILEEGLACGDDATAYGELNARFHAQISQGAHNATLLACHAELTLRTQVWRSTNFTRDARRLDSSRAEHRAITDAILAGEPDRTRTLMRQHVASSLITLTDILALGD